MFSADHTSSQQQSGLSEIDLWKETTFTTFAITTLPITEETKATETIFVKKTDDDLVKTRHSLTTITKEENVFDGSITSQIQNFLSTSHRNLDFTNDLNLKQQTSKLTAATIRNITESEVFSTPTTNLFLKSTPYISIDQEEIRKPSTQGIETNGNTSSYDQSQVTATSQTPVTTTDSLIKTTLSETQKTKDKSVTEAAETTVDFPKSTEPETKMTKAKLKTEVSKTTTDYLINTSGETKDYLITEISKTPSSYPMNTPPETKMTREDVVIETSETMTDYSMNASPQTNTTKKNLVTETSDATTNFSINTMPETTMMKDNLLTKTLETTTDVSINTTLEAKMTTDDLVTKASISTAHFSINTPPETQTTKDNLVSGTSKITSDFLISTSPDTKISEVNHSTKQMQDAAFSTSESEYTNKFFSTFKAKTVSVTAGYLISKKESSNIESYKTNTKATKDLKNIMTSTLYTNRQELKSTSTASELNKESDAPTKINDSKSFTLKAKTTVLETENGLSRFTDEEHFLTEEKTTNINKLKTATKRKLYHSTFPKLTSSDEKIITNLLKASPFESEKILITETQKHDTSTTSTVFKSDEEFETNSPPTLSFKNFTNSKTVLNNHTEIDAVHVLPTESAISISNTDNISTANRGTTSNALDASLTTKTTFEQSSSKLKEKETKDEFEKIDRELVELLERLAPIRTGFKGILQTVF